MRQRAVPAESVEHGDVGKHVEDVVGVGRVVVGGPLLGRGRGRGEEGRLRLALIINAIKPYHLHKTDHDPSCNVPSCNFFSRQTDRQTDRPTDRHLVEENAEVLVGRRVQCGLKQRQEQVPQELSEILQQLLLPVDVTAEVHVSTTR